MNPNGPNKELIARPYTDPQGRWWWVDQKPDKPNKLPEAPTYQDFKNPALQAFARTDPDDPASPVRTCAMWEVPGLPAPWEDKKNFPPRTQVLDTMYFQTWVVSEQPLAIGVHHRPIGYIDWKFNVEGTVGVDQSSTRLLITESSYNWRDSPGRGTDEYANLVGNYPRFQ